MPDMSQENNAAVQAPETQQETADGIPLIVNGRRLNDVEIQALREAKARRAKIDAAAQVPPEKGHKPRASEPSRYGDWEQNGRAIDFS